MKTIVSQLTPDELVEFALRRKKCFEHLRSKLSELTDEPDGMIVIVSEKGNYTVGYDVFVAVDLFKEMFPVDTSPFASFCLGDVR